MATRSYTFTQGGATSGLLSSLTPPVMHRQESLVCCWVEDPRQVIRGAQAKPEIERVGIKVQIRPYILRILLHLQVRHNWGHQQLTALPLLRDAAQ